MAMRQQKYNALNDKAELVNQKAYQEHNASLINIAKNSKNRRMLDMTGLYSEDEIRSNAISYATLMTASGFCRSLPTLHRESISCMTWFQILGDKKDTFYIITGSLDHTLALWTFDPFTSIHQYIGHDAQVIAVTMLDGTSPYGTSRGASQIPRVVSVSADGAAIVWDALSGKALLQVSRLHEGCIFDVKAALWKDICEEPVCVTVAKDMRVLLWNSSSGSIIREFTGRHNNYGQLVATVALYKSNIEDVGRDSFPLVITAGYDNTIIVWNAATGDNVFTLRGHVWSIIHLAIYTPSDGSQPLLCSAAYDSQVILWDLETGQPFRRDTHHESAVISVAVYQPIVESGPILVSVDLNGHIIFEDMISGRVIRKLLADPLQRDVELFAYNFQLPNIIIERRGNLGPVFLHTDKSGTSLVAWDFSAEDAIINVESGHSNDITAMDSISIQNQFYVATGSKDKTIVVWKDELIVCICKGHSDVIASIKFIPPTQKYGLLRIVSVGFEPDIYIWDALSGNLIHKCLSPHSVKIHSLDYFFCKKTRTSVIVTGGWDKMAYSWDVDTMAIMSSFDLSSLPGLNGRIWAIRVFEPSPKSVNEEDNLSSLNSTGDQDQRRTGHHAISTTALVITGGWMGMLFVWNLETGELLFDLSGIHKKVIATLYMHFQESTGMSYLLCGSYDSSISIFNLLTGEFIKLLDAHQSPIESVLSFSSPIFNGVPVVVSGSSNGTIKLWNLYTGDEIVTLNGHRDRIINIAILESNDPHLNPPVLVSLGLDAQIVLWDLSYDLANIMPPRGSVMRAFELDLKDTEWSRIQAFSDRFGEGFWLENNYLFTFASWKKRPDFCVFFKDMLLICIRSLRLKVGEFDLLEFLLVEGDLSTMTVIMECWIIELNKKIRNSADQRLWHLSYFIKKKDLLRLSVRYPAVFADLICSLRLPLADKCVNTMHLSYDIPDGQQLIHCCSPWESIKLFDRILPPEMGHNGQPVSVLFLPLRGCIGMDMLEAFVNVSNELGNEDIFNSEIANTVLRYSWRKFGMRIHNTLFCIYVIYLAVFVTAVYSFDHLLQTFAGSIVAWLLQTAVLTFQIYFIREEYMQFSITSDSSLFAHAFDDIWNQLDFAITFTTILGILFRIGYRCETASSRCTLAVASVIGWFKLLNYLRPYRVSGPLVSMIKEIVMDIRVFLAVLAVVLCGFAQAFWLLSYPDNELTFGTVRSAFLNTFLFMLGSFDTDFSGTASPELATALLVGFLLFMMILMLNLLIALMGETFGRVNEKGIAVWRLEQAMIVLEERYKLTAEDMDIPPSAYVMKYTHNLPRMEEDEDRYRLPSTNFSEIYSATSKASTEFLHEQAVEAVARLQRTELQIIADFATREVIRTRRRTTVQLDSSEHNLVKETNENANFNVADQVPVTQQLTTTPVENSSQSASPVAELLTSKDDEISVCTSNNIELLNLKLGDKDNANSVGMDDVVVKVDFTEEAASGHREQPDLPIQMQTTGQSDPAKKNGSSFTLQFQELQRYRMSSSSREAPVNPEFRHDMQTSGNVNKVTGVAEERHTEINSISSTLIDKAMELEDGVRAVSAAASQIDRRLEELLSAMLEREHMP